MVERLTVTLDVVSLEVLEAVSCGGISVLNETADGCSFLRASFLEQRLER